MGKGEKRPQAVGKERAGSRKDGKRSPCAEQPGPCWLPSPVWERGDGGEADGVWGAGVCPGLEGGVRGMMPWGWQWGLSLVQVEASLARGGMEAAPT